MAQLGATETSRRRQLQPIISASTCNGAQKIKKKSQSQTSRALKKSCVQCKNCIARMQLAFKKMDRKLSCFHNETFSMAGYIF